MLGNTCNAENNVILLPYQLINNYRGITMQTIKQYVLSEFTKCTIRDIHENGMVSGFGQLIYYHDTVKFHDEHKDEIWDMLYEEAEQNGMTICELIASFNGQKNVGSIEQFKNMLCWFAVENICAALLNYFDEENITIDDEYFYQCEDCGNNCDDSNLIDPTASNPKSKFVCDECNKKYFKEI
jgi:hypothetical protein